jgi:hypothetical protein
MGRIYAGIGSRETPDEALRLMRSIASAMERGGWKLRSGGAPGADTAFQKSVRAAKNKAIYLPWRVFNNNVAGYHGCWDASKLPTWDAALATVDKYHPEPNKLSEAGRKLMARNAFQVLGPDLNTSADVVLCWTPDGKVTGGTGQALRIAMDRDILIVNLGNDRHCEAFSEALKECANKGKEPAFGNIKLT